MPYGYVGQNAPSQIKENTGVFTIDEAYELEKSNNWGGAYTLLDTKDCAGLAQVNFTDLKESKFDVHEFHGYGIRVSSPDTLRLKVSNDGGSTYEGTSSYDNALIQNPTSTSLSNLTRSGFTSFDRIVANTQNIEYSFKLIMGNAGKSDYFTHFLMISNSFSSTFLFKQGVGVYRVAEVVDAVQFFMTTYNMDAGTIKCYGYKI